MDGYADNLNFIRALSKHPSERKDEDLKVIYLCLRHLDVFGKLGEGPLRALCKHSRYERHRANDTLFRRGQLSSCWYILVSGAVFMDRHMYFPRDSFGKRSGQSNRRAHDCFILEPSEMIVVDYPDVHHIPTNKPTAAGVHATRKEIQSMNLDGVGPYVAQQLPSYDYARAMNRNAAGGHLSASSSSGYSQNGGGTLKKLTASRRAEKDYYGQQAQHAVTSSSSTLDVTASAAPTYYYDGGHRLEQLENVDDLAAVSSSYHDGTFPGRRGNAGAANSSSPRRRGVGSGTGGSPAAPTNTLNVKRLNRVRSTVSSTASTTSTSASHNSTGGGGGTELHAAEADDELMGLPETNVDSDTDEEEDDESCPSADSFLELKDHVRTCLEKEPALRDDDDVHVLLDFMQHMPAFANLPVCVKRQLCLAMVFAVVDRAGQIVMGDQEQLDSWSVIVNGEVEVVLPDGQRVEYHLGDSFGVDVGADARPQRHHGTMRTLVDDCQFVLVAQEDFVRIMSKAADNLKRHKDAAGEIVSETERRTLDSHEGYVLIKGKPEKLIMHLIEERDTSVDLYYVEDFLLVYRTFLPNPVTVFEKLQQWFAETHLRDKVARLVLLWTNNHFNDFETNSEMLDMLEKFEQALEREGMPHHQQLLNIACSVKSRPRTVTYTRSNRDEVLHFHILGGYEKGYGIFISKVEPDTQAERVGLKRGDEILEVNNDNFQHRTHQKALEMLRGSTHLSITVKSNLLGFREMLQATDRARHPPSGQLRGNKTSEQLMALRTGGGQRGLCGTSQSAAQLPGRGSALTTPRADGQHRERVLTGGARHPSVPAAAGGKFIDRLLGRLKNGVSTDEPFDASVAQPPHTPSSRIKPSLSNPDISSSVHGTGASKSFTDISQYYQPVPSNSPEHVLKIYRGDQSFKYLTVYRETTAQNVVQLALQEFNMLAGGSSLEWSLCEVTVTTQGGVIKQRRLPDALQNLAERIQLNSRYYLKNNLKSDNNLVPDELAPELLKEATTQLLQLNAQTLAAQLTLQDFAVFAAIEPTEYVDNLFKLDSRYGWPRLAAFEQLVNKEMWWVTTEICRQTAVLKRARLIRKFIKVARHCRDFRNFNSMFAIASGLEKPAVRRLQTTWDKVPSKYHKMFDDIRLILDPSRNMSCYRQHLHQVSLDPPVIPLLPVVKKDLTFIHEGNPTYCEGLVNFEKLRMIAKEVRALGKLSSAPYELGAMSEQSGAGRLNDALLHMNSFEGGNTVATMRKANQVKGPQPRKKLYEQALMVRKVKSYLANLTVISDEHQLDKLSQDLEPAAHGGSLGSVNVGRKRLPSPSPSSNSSVSNNSDPRRILAVPKFGVDSPQAVQKMLSLVNHSRVKPGAPVRSSSSANAPPDNHHPHHLHADAHGQYSPVVVRRSHGGHLRHPPPPLPPAMNRAAGGGRSQSEVFGVNVRPVDLTAESSSVTPSAVLPPAALRISSTGSVTSTDSALSQQSALAVSLASASSYSPGVVHAISCESTDSGHASLAPSALAAAGSPQHSASSPSLARRSHPPSTLENKQQQQSTRTKVMVGAAMMHRGSAAFPAAALRHTSAVPPPPAGGSKYVNVHVGPSRSGDDKTKKKPSELVSRV